MTFEEMIAAAEARFDEAEEGSTEAIQAQAQAEALKVARDAGYTKTQSDLNSADKKTREAFETYKKRVEGLVGNLDEFENVITTQVPSAGSEGGSKENGDAPLLERLNSELRSRDEAIKEEREKRESFERELRQERLYGDLNRRFKELSLQDAYAEAAKEFVSPRMDSIVEKAMQGEDVSGDLQSQAERLKELSPVWFQEEPSEDEIAIPGVPRSANGGQPRELTDEERLKRAAPPVV